MTTIVATIVLEGEVSVGRFFVIGVIHAQTSEERDVKSWRT